VFFVFIFLALVQILRKRENGKLALPPEEKKGDHRPPEKKGE